MTQRQDFIRSTGLPLDINLLKTSAENGGDRYFMRDGDAPTGVPSTSRVDGLESSLNTEKARINDLVGDVAVTSTRVAVLTTTVDDLRDDVDVLESDIVAVRAAMRPKGATLTIDQPSFTMLAGEHPLPYSTITHHDPAAPVVTHGSVGVVIAPGLYNVSLRLDGDVIGASNYSNALVGIKYVPSSLFTGIGFVEVGQKTRGMHLYTTVAIRLGGHYAFVMRGVTNDVYGDVAGEITLTKVAD